MFLNAWLDEPFLLPFLEEGYVKMFLKGRPVTMFMPKDQVDSYSLEARGELPSNKLKLDWVYPAAAACAFSAETKAETNSSAE